MSATSSQTPNHQPHRPDTDVPDETDPGAPPVEPDEGPTPAQFPTDPEPERVLDPSVPPIRAA